MFTVLEILHIYKTPFSIILKSLSPTQSWCLKKDRSSTSNLQFIYSLSLSNFKNSVIFSEFTLWCSALRCDLQGLSLACGGWNLSSPTKHWTLVCCAGRRTLYHWTAREVRWLSFKMLLTMFFMKWGPMFGLFGYFLMVLALYLNSSCYFYTYVSMYVIDMPRLSSLRVW